MQRTYWIRYNTINGVKFDKITYKDVDDRPRFHKLGALDSWKRDHKGYSYLRINSVYTKSEMKANGYDAFL